MLSAELVKKCQEWSSAVVELGVQPDLTAALVAFDSDLHQLLYYHRDTEDTEKAILSLCLDRFFSVSPVPRGEKLLDLK